MKRANKNNKKTQSSTNVNKVKKNSNSNLTAQAVTSDGIQAQRNLMLRVPRNTFIMPDRLYTKLVFSGSNTAIVLAASNSVAVRFRPSSAFDVDPTIGGTTMPGFTELGTLYSSYRVLSSTIKVNAVLGTTSPAGTPTMVVLPLNLDPGGSPSAATVVSWPGNPFAQYKLLPTNGSTVTQMSLSMSTEKIFGSKTVYFDDNYQALVSASPVLNWYWAIGFVISPSVASNVTIAYSIEIESGIEFFERKQMNN
jgi:hypothetical protein